MGTMSLSLTPPPLVVLFCPLSLTFISSFTQVVLTTFELLSYIPRASELQPSPKVLILNNVCFWHELAGLRKTAWKLRTSTTKDSKDMRQSKSVFH